ncbi:hypothetical protein [Prosthecobacter sp.]|jgi:hypothetical protein|uniref:hypothetical protein n=1 Tax=Prosthecobacter sp. TaxID=1965333 RepID=UPI0037CCA70A
MIFTFTHTRGSIILQAILCLIFIINVGVISYARGFLNGAKEMHQEWKKQINALEAKP